MKGSIDCRLSLDLYTDYKSYWYYAATFGVRLYYKMYSYGSDILHGPESPVDGLGIQWGRDEWDFRNQNSYDSITEASHISWDNGSQQGGDGVGWFVDDVQMCRDNGYTGTASNTNYGWTDREHVTVYLNQGPDHVSGRSYISGSYTHSWSGTATGLTLSYPFGIGLTGSGNIKQQDLATDLNVRDLKVYAQDAS